MSFATTSAMESRVREVLHAWAVRGLGLDDELVLWANQPGDPDWSSAKPVGDHATLYLTSGPSRVGLDDEVITPHESSARDTLTVDQQRELTLNVQTFGPQSGDRMKSLVDSMGLPSQGASFGCAQETIVEIVEAADGETYTILIGDEPIEIVADIGDSIFDIRDALLIELEGAETPVSGDVEDIGAGRAALVLTGYGSGFHFSVELGERLAVYEHKPAVDLVILDDVGTTDISGLMDAVWYEQRRSCDFRIWLATRVEDDPGFVEHVIGEGDVTGTIGAPLDVPFDVEKGGG